MASIGSPSMKEIHTSRKKHLQSRGLNRHNLPERNPIAVIRPGSPPLPSPDPMLTASSLSSARMS